MGNSSSSGEMNPSVWHLLEPLLQDIPGPPLCAGCGKHFATIAIAGDDRRTFQVLTGLRYRDEMVGFPLVKDRRALGLTTQELPPQVALCLPCANAYMTRFNALSQEGEGERHG